MESEMNTPKRYNRYQIADLEAYLQSTLHPVNPRPAFVTGLKSRLAQITPVARSTPKTLQYAIIGVAGAATAAVLVISGVRAAVTIIGALGLMFHLTDQARQKKGNHMQPMM
jgi:hypothetical protein